MARRPRNAPPRAGRTSSDTCSWLPPYLPECRQHRLEVLVASATQVDQDVHRLLHRSCHPKGHRDSMGTLQRRENPLAPGQDLEGLQRFQVGTADVLSPSRGLERRVLRANSGVIETRGDRVGFDDLTLVALEDHGVGPMEYAGPTFLKRGTVMESVHPFPRRLDTHQPGIGDRK